MGREIKPQENDQPSRRISKAWNQIAKYVPSKKMAHQAYHFLTKLFFLRQLRERKQLENMLLYLKAVDEAVKQLEKAGVPKQTIREFLLQLHVPLIEASLKAMLLLRKCEEQENNDQAKAEPFGEAYKAEPDE